MTPQTDSRKKRVFIIDDHPLVCEWVANLINQQKDMAVCGEAATAPEALQAVIAMKPDVAMVDISLKNSSGIELIKDLQRLCPQVAVLVLSMHEESHYAERALRAGARGYVMKTEATRKVIEAIRRVLEGKFYLSETVAQAITTQFVDGKSLVSSPLEILSDRELAVFNLLGQGLSTRQIGEALQLSIKTVQAYCVRIKEKLKLNSATDLVCEAVRQYEAKNQV
jgi:DNA-binding NarL/FixJ family response regulator